jgi:hypothetical protein
MLGKADVKEMIEKERLGQFDSAYGPNLFWGQRVWEVWTLDKGADEYDTRFVIEPPKGRPFCLESFQNSSPTSNRTSRGIRVGS